MPAARLVVITAAGPTCVTVSPVRTVRCGPWTSQMSMAATGTPRTVTMRPGRTDGMRVVGVTGGQGVVGSNAAVPTQFRGMIRDLGEVLGTMLIYRSDR
jgi:hypothetical protein